MVQARGKCVPSSFLIVFLLLGCSPKRIFSQEARCGHPAVPVNSRVSLSNPDLKQGTTATYTCDEGYELFGASILVCLPSGSWQGDIPFCGTNIALMKPANQSTTVRGGAAANGNDGERTPVHDGKSCTETMKEASPWWMVDLLKPYPVRVVRVATRGCCGHQPLKDIEIRVGNSSSDLQRNPLCAWFPGTIEEGVTKTFTCARTLVGQHVFLQLVGVEGSLSVCEVEVFTTDEFSNDRCAPPGSSPDVELASFDRTCYELSIARGGSFLDARTHCQKHGGDLVHGLEGAATPFLLAQLERRKPTLKTQLVWIGATKEPGFTTRTWRWVNGEVVSRPSWGKEQPNNYNGEQNCVVLDGGRNWLWNDVGCNLDYLHWVCQRSPSDCGSPDKLLNTTISGSNYSVEAVISYQCPLGHRLVGEKNRSCTVNGFWSGQAPGCQYVDCGSLSKLDHGVVMLEDNRTTHGAWARYSCHENYTLTGREKRQCGDDGKWSDEPPQCLFDWCPEPPVVHGGTVEVSGRRTGSVAIYTCKSGFIPFGEPVLSCGLGGEWSGKAPTCKYVDCGAPPNTDNGRYNLLNGTTYGSIVEYSCDVDYWLDGTQRQSCTREGRWSADTPACVLITCDEPEVPPNSEVVGYDFNVHSSIEYRCEVGHLLRGEAIRECTMQGEWSGEPPDCEYIDCGKVPSVPYGSVTYVNETTYIGSQILYSCVRNYRLTGVSYRECQENKQWSGESSRCEEIRCPEPTLTDHSILSVTGNDRVYGRTLIRTADSAASVTTYKIGALAKYRCERGYKIVGEPLSTCEDTGRWSGEMPQCACEYNCHTPDTYIDTPVDYQQQGDAFFTTKNSFTKNVNDAHLRTHDLAVDDPTNYNVCVNTNNLMNYQIQDVKSHFLENNIISSPINRHKFGIEKPVIHVPVNYLRPEARPWRGNTPALILDTYPPINEIQNVNLNSQPYSRHQNEQPLYTQNKQRYKNKLKETDKGKYDKANSQAHKYNFVDTDYNNHNDNYLPDIPNFHVKLLRNEELKLHHDMPPKLFMNNFISNSHYEPFVRTVIPHEKDRKMISKQNILPSTFHTDKRTRKPSENIPKLPVNINNAPLRLEKPSVSHRVPLDNYLVPPGSLLAPLTELYKPPEDVPSNKLFQAVQMQGPEPFSKEVHANIEHGHALDECWKFHNGFIVCFNNVKH